MHTLTNLLSPLVKLYLHRRLRQGREDAARFNERLGIASMPRPSEAKRLIWCHAASVGEAVSALPVIAALVARESGLHVLLTTGTVTSARVVAARLPERTLHQYVPADVPAWVEKFLSHWQPDAVLWIESELWPNMLAAIRLRQIPAALINARMSPRSYKHWRVFAPSWVRRMLETFSIILAQTLEDQARLEALGARHVSFVGNLKYAAHPLSCDENELAILRAVIAGRPVWLMASTHTGEDEIALAVHQHLQKRWADILTIIIPRHPKRGGDIATLANKSGLSVMLRSSNPSAPISCDKAVYIADTIGETGLFFRLVRTVCVAGSFTWEGHNPLEPAKLGCAVVFGPRMGSFKDIAASMVATNRAVQVNNASQLADKIEYLLATPEDAIRMGKYAVQVMQQGEIIISSVTEKINKTILTNAPYLGDKRTNW